jgi:predicted nucleotidyltransferase
MLTNTPHFSLALRISQYLAAASEVQAVAVGGSLPAGWADEKSDIDLYVFTTTEIPLAKRQALVDEFGAAHADLDLRFWDLGDEWIHAATGIEIDLIYWDTKWISGQIERVLDLHQANTGYTTCFWHTLRHIHPLFDRQGWLAGLKAKAAQPFPSALRYAILNKNMAVMRGCIPALENQTNKALQRGDAVSVNHRVAALLASYFDTLFAFNWLTHPGEKRLVEYALKHCRRLPDNLEEDIAALLRKAGEMNPEMSASLKRLIDGLEQCFAAGELPALD